MPAAAPLLVHLPEASCALGGVGLLAFAREAQATAPLPRRVGAAALGLSLVGLLARAPQSAGAWLGPDTFGRLGLPLLVWFALALGLSLAQSRPRSARAADLAWLLLLGAPLLRLATWPSGGSALWALLLAVPPLALLGWSALRGLPAGLLGCVLVATGAGVAPFVDVLVWRDRVPAAVPAWLGTSLALVLLVLTLVGPQTPRRVLLGASLAQLSLLVAAAAVGTGHAMYGALAGAAWAWLAPLLALWALVSGLEESADKASTCLARNRPQRVAAGLALLALCGAPLTPGFAARVGMSEAALRAGLTWPTALSGVALGLLVIVCVRAYLNFAVSEGEVREPWVFDARAALVAAFLPWVFLGLELTRPGLCGGGAWGS